MFDVLAEVADFMIDLWVNKILNRFSCKEPEKKQNYDKDQKIPILKCSICNGEQVAGFKDIRTGKFEEVSLIRSEKELDDFMKTYGISEITKEY